LQQLHRVYRFDTIRRNDAQIQNEEGITMAMSQGAARRMLTAFLMVGLPALVWATPQSFTLPGHGSLLLNVPAGWTAKMNQSSGGRPAMVSVGPASGAAFGVLITAVFGPTPDAGAPDDAKIRAFVASSAKSVEGQSVEGALSLKEFVGVSGRGYYFRATDKAPAAGEWKYLTQGMVKTGGIGLSFTILTNDGQGEIEKAALEMIRSAVQQPSESV
jgi:hypothetical protein